MVRKSLNVAPELDAELGERHKPYEDVLAMLLGTLFVALGVVIYARLCCLSEAWRASRSCCST